MKKTKWYPADSRPVYVGIYETKSPVLNNEEGWMCYWNGYWWGEASHKSYCDWEQMVLERSNCKTRNQNREWRGLASWQGGSGHAL